MRSLLFLTFVTPILSACQSGFYLNGMCIKCPVDTYCVTDRKNNCPSNTATITEGNTNVAQCNYCKAGYFYYDYLSCSACPVGTYTSSKLQLTRSCTSCPVNTFAASVGSTTCSTCAANTIAGTGASACLVCTSGYYMPNNNECIMCAAGTYSSTVNSACPMSVAGYYVSAVGMSAQSACMAGTYSSSSGSTTCTQCAPGTYSSISAATTCTQCLPGTLSATGASACGSCTTCGATYWTKSDCTLIAYADCQPCTVCRSDQYQTADCLAKSDRQCASCLPCMRGSVLKSPCASTTQTVCSICSGYELNQTCVSSVPMGYYPYIYRYPSALLVASSAVIIPTYVDNNQIVWTSDMTITSLVRCDTPPLSKMLLPYVSGSGSVTCSSIPCDVTVSSSSLCATQCAFYNGSKGYFGDGTTCSPCTTASQYSACTWGQYSNLSACGPLIDAPCAPCRGTLPANAIWTIPKPPFYFDNSEPEPCQWDCEPGFYKSNNQCVACTAIPNSVWLPGDLSGTTSIMWTLNPTTSKFFGGNPSVSIESRCNFQCEFGYTATLRLFANPRYYTCDACTTTTCEPGTTSVFDPTTGCKICSACLGTAPPNAMFYSDCSWVCNSGYYRSGSTCVACDTSSCTAGQFKTQCTNLSNSVCSTCSTCMPGKYTLVPCGALDTECGVCQNTLPANAHWSSGCLWQCNSGYVSDGVRCLACKTTFSQCAYNQQVTANCTADNLGCTMCAEPQTYNWCWTGTSQCSWSCLTKYLKVSGQCVYSAAVTTSPACADSNYHLDPSATSSPLTTTRTTTPAPTTVATTTRTTTNPLSTSSVRSTTTRLVLGSTSTTSSLSTTVAGSTTLTTLQTEIPTMIAPTTAPQIATTTIPTTIITTTATLSSTTAVPVVDQFTGTTSVAKLQNYTVASAACSYEFLQQRLTSYYNTHTVILSISDQSSTISCYPQPCPCPARRNMPQDTVSLKYWYPGPAQSSVALSSYIPGVAEVVVIDVSAASLPRASVFLTLCLLMVFRFIY